MSTFRGKYAEWRTWLAQLIHVEQDLVPRHVAIRTFCEDHLVPYVQQAGYTWAKDTTRVAEDLLNLLFVVYKRKEITFPDAHHAWDPVHFDDFTWRLDAEAWDLFWEGVPAIEDFAEDKYAYDVRYHIYLFVWNHLDLSKSRVVIAKIQEQEEQERDELRFAGQDDAPHDAAWFQDKHKHN